MTRKELKKIIKAKAMDVEVKDFSASIIERAKHLPQTSIETVKEKRSLWRIKPLTTSLITVFSTFILVLLLINQTGVDPQPEAAVLADMENIVALSTVQATSLIEVMDSELSAESISVLRFGPQEKNDLIQDELTDLARYLETIEKLYASNENFEVIDEIEEANGFNRRIRFRTRDFINKETQYEIKYNQNFNPQTNRFQVLGQIRLGEKQFDLELEGTKGSKNIVMTVKKDETNYVVLNYEVIDGIDTYTVELIKNDASIEKVMIILTEDEDEKVATLSFIEGTSTGTYTFTITEEDSRKIIQIQYELDFDGEIETGNITIRVLTLQQITLYSIIVQPEGRAPFSFTRGRFASQNPPQNSQNM
jgi:hypothetical protein